MVPSTGATWTTGKSGGALSLDGNNYVQISGLLGQPQNITISAWANLSAKDTLGAEIVSLGDHVAIRLDGSNDTKGFYCDGTTWRGTATGISYAGTGWHHVVYVMDDTNNMQKAYVDGVEKGSTAFHGFMGTNNGDTYTSVTPLETATPIRSKTVILRSVKAGTDDGRVILTWVTSGESDSAGFNLIPGQAQKRYVYPGQRCTHRCK